MRSELPMMHTPILPISKGIPPSISPSTSMYGAVLQHSKSLVISIFFVFTLAITLTSCGGSGNNGSSSTPTTQGTLSRGSSDNQTIATPSPGIGPRPCPDAVKAPSHWDAIIPTQNGVTQVENVMCGNLTGSTTLQALVTVRYHGTGQILDVYVYNDITSPSPSQLFRLQNLYKGNAKISVYNTVLTAEVDQNSSINAGKSDTMMGREHWFRYLSLAYFPT